MVMKQRSDVTHSMGVPVLDDLLGGLLAGDNVVWVGDRTDLHDQIETSLLESGDGSATLVVLDSRSGALHLPDNVELIDGRPGRPHADLVTLERELIHRGSRPDARIVIQDPDTFVSRLGSKAALGLFSRICPRLFDQGAIGYWRSSREVSSSILDRVQRVTQCVIDHTSGRLRVVKAEGRTQAVGRIFDVATQPDGVTLEEVRALSRLADGVRRLRTSRILTQTENARLADVSPSAISQVESGQRGLNLDTVLTLSQALNVSIDEMIGPPRPNPRSKRSHAPARQPRHRSPRLSRDIGAGESGEPKQSTQERNSYWWERVSSRSSSTTGHPYSAPETPLLVTTDAIHGWKNLLPETAQLFWIARD